MAEAARKPATFEDVLSAPANRIAEIVDGELSLQPRPALPHAAASSGLGGELAGPFQRGRGGPGGWLIVFEPELHLDADILVPDLAGWRRERLPALPNGPFVTLPPDWICEVVSPSTAALDRVRKPPIYARAGVRNVWLVDPLARTLEVLRLESGRWAIVSVHSEDDRVRAEPFDAIELELGVLWADVER
jgi:Uma2 family endonuclease